MFFAQWAMNGDSILQYDANIYTNCMSCLKKMHKCISVGLEPKAFILHNEYLCFHIIYLHVDELNYWIFITEMEHFKIRLSDQIFGIKLQSYTSKHLRSCAYKWNKLNNLGSKPSFKDGL